LSPGRLYQLIRQPKPIADRQFEIEFMGSGPFRAPYHGPNSLDSNAGRETWDVTFYAGMRLWEGAELWVNPAAASPGSLCCRDDEI
jgi:hypothetical protein